MLLNQTSYCSGESKEIRTKVNIVYINLVKLIQEKRIQINIRSVKGHNYRCYTIKEINYVHLYAIAFEDVNEMEKNYRKMQL